MCGDPSPGQVGIPWLARERRRQRRLYQRQNTHLEAQEILDEESDFAADLPTLKHAYACFELAKSAYSITKGNKISALDRCFSHSQLKAIKSSTHHVPTHSSLSRDPVGAERDCSEDTS